MTLPLRAPPAAGLNATVTLQLPPAGTVLQLFPMIGNSAAELDTMLVTVTAFPDGLLIAKPVPLLCTPTVCEPRLTEAGTDSEPCPPPAPPVPDTANDCGLPMPLLTTVIWPLRAPVAAGTNWTLIEHEPVGGSTNVPDVQVVLTIGNSSGLLLVAVELSWTAALPVIVTLRVWTALPTPTACEPKLMVDGITSEAEAPPPNVCR